MNTVAVDFTSARAMWAELNAGLALAPAGSVLVLRGTEVAGLCVAHIAVAEAVFCASTGTDFEIDGQGNPVVGSQAHIDAAKKLDRYHPGRYLLTACERVSQFLESTQGVPWPADMPRGAGAWLASKDVAAAAPLMPGDYSFGVLPIAGWIVIGVVGVAAVAAGTYLGDEYISESQATETEVGKAKAEANAHAKIEIAKAKLEAGQPVSLDEIDAADADAYQKRQLVKDVAPWVIGGLLAAGVALVAARKAKIL